MSKDKARNKVQGLLERCLVLSHYTQLKARRARKYWPALERFKNFLDDPDNGCLNVWMDDDQLAELQSIIKDLKNVRI